MGGKGRVWRGGRNRDRIREGLRGRDEGTDRGRDEERRRVLNERGWEEDG